MSNIPAVYPPGQEPATEAPRPGYAKDGRPESARPYPAGTEPGTTAHGDDKAR